MSIDIEIEIIDSYFQDVTIWYDRPRSRDEGRRGIVVGRLSVSDRVELARKFRHAAEQLMSGLDKLDE